MRRIPLNIAIALALLVLADAPTRPARAQPSRGVTKLPIEARQAEGFDSAESAGLFVGIRHFEDKEFLEVPFAVDDAVDLAHLFVFELELIRPGKVVLALAGEPQKTVSRGRLKQLRQKGAAIEPAAQTDVLRLLIEQRKASGRKGLFVAAFATHGFSDQGSDFLVAADTLWPFVQRTGVALDETFDVVVRAHAPRRLVLLDACRKRFTATPRRGSMSASFADAIAGARGQAVLSGATLGGYSYDDEDRGNGVFTAAVIDGLLGGAPTDERSFITVQTLAEYVNDRVIAWVGDRHLENENPSSGISRRLDGAVAAMPLAADNSRLRVAADYKKRRDAALDRLRRNLEAPLTGSMYDQMSTVLGSDDPSPERLKLIEEIEALDDSARMRRALESYWRTRSSSPSPPAGPFAPLEIGGREVAAPSSVEARLLPLKDPAPDIELVVVDRGTFRMGSPKGEKGRQDDETPHSVTVTRRFQLGKTEVTQGQWQQLMGNNPSEDDTCGAECPVESVNWYEALAFANELSRRYKLERCYELSGDNGQKAGEGLVYRKVVFKGLDCPGYRLPTEAEWEMAARAGGVTARFAGTDDPSEVCDYGNVATRSSSEWLASSQCNDGHEFLAPVARFSPNRLGLHDMTGNVREWVWDRYALYEGDARDPEGPASSLIPVFRGGSFSDRPQNARVAHRSFGQPSDRDPDLGFRVARTLP